MLRKPSPSEPITELRHIRIVECGEELIDFLQFCPDLRLDRPRFVYRRETLLRQSAAEKLCRADRLLPKGYRLAIIEGWRPPHIQRRMYQTVWNWFQEQHPDWSDVTLKRVVNRFSAPLNDRVPPPHSTGGAVDVMLAGEAGEELDHTSPFDPFDPRCAAFDAPDLSENALKHRRILADALLEAGLTNYPSEYWHWSFGDQGWAYRGGHPHALYKSITPSGYEAAPEDLIDEPLERIDPPESNS